jgi:hypothetical protein
MATGVGDEAPPKTEARMLQKNPCNSGKENAVDPLHSRCLSGSQEERSSRHRN